MPTSLWKSIERLVLINFSLAQQDHLLNEIAIISKVDKKPILLKHVKGQRCIEDISANFLSILFLMRYHLFFNMRNLTS